jgi:RNA polymerase sigma factor (sigma-70 family)
MGWRDRLRAGVRAWLEGPRPGAVDPPRPLVENRRVQVSPDQALLLHGPEMRAWLRRLLEDRDDAEDAYREACLRVIRFADKQREPRPEALRAWVLRIARREGYRKLRQRVRDRGRAVRLKTEDAEVLPIEGPGISTALRERQLEGQRLERLRRILLELTPSDTALLTLRFQEGLSHREIGARLAAGGAPIAEAAVRKRLSRVIAKLRTRAEAEGLAELVAS